MKITNEPGSAPDRVVINVDVEEQSTGDFSIMGGYSTADGWLGRSLALGTQPSRHRPLCQHGGDLRRVHTQCRDGFLPSRIFSIPGRLGLDLFAKQTLANSYLSYGTESYGGTLKWGLPIREDLAMQLRYSLYTQKITLPSYLNDCNNINPDFANTFPTLNGITAGGCRGGISRSPPSTRLVTCMTYGQASLPVREELADGAT